MNCDFCGQSGHADTPCPVRRESAMRHAAEGRKLYPPASGIEAMVCETIRKTIRPNTAERLCAEIAARQRLGVKKYGKELADNPALLKERMRHALEEILDFAVYCRWAAQQEAFRATMLRFESESISNASLLLIMIDEVEGRRQP